MSDFASLLRPFHNRINNMLARGKLSSVKADAKMQVLQLQLLDGEVKDRLEHFEPYGFTSHPNTGSAEAAVMFLDGDRSHGVVLVVADRKYRMRALKAGEVAIHDSRGQSVHLTEEGIVVKGGGLPMVFEDTPSITFKADNFVRFETPRVETTQLLQAQQLTIGGVLGGVGAAVATMNGGNVNFNSVTFAYQAGTVTYALTTIVSDGRRVDGGHTHPVSGATTLIPNPP